MADERHELDGQEDGAGRPRELERGYLVQRQACAATTQSITSGLITSLDLPWNIAILEDPLGVMDSCNLDVCSFAAASSRLSQRMTR